MPEYMCWKYNQLFKQLEQYILKELNGHYSRVSDNAISFAGMTSSQHSIFTELKVK